MMDDDSDPESEERETFEIEPDIGSDAAKSPVFKSISLSPTAGALSSFLTQPRPRRPDTSDWKSGLASDSEVTKRVNACYNNHCALWC